jgi:hypothetical protein
MNMLTETQRRALFLEMHRNIENAAGRVAAQLTSREGLQLSYPPNHGLTDNEISALRNLNVGPGLESAFRKAIASAVSEPLYYLMCILDGIGEPAELGERWFGARIDPIPPEPDGMPEAEPLRYDYYESYWEWRRIRPDPGWRLDDLKD